MLTKSRTLSAIQVSVWNKFLLIATAAGLLAACGNPSNTPATPEVEMIRLDEAVVALSDTSTLSHEAEEGIDAWLYVTRGIIPGKLLPSDRESILCVERQSASFGIFREGVEKNLPDLTPALSEIGRLKDFPTKVYGVVWPYSQSVAVVDTTVVVALNHYLGPDYEGYASFPEYIRRLKTAERMPLDVGEAWISARYPFPDSVASPTLMQRMAYQGAVLAAVADELQVTDGPLLLGWTPEEWKSAKDNEREAWRRIVGGEMLFSDDPLLAGRLLSPSPATVDVSPDAPGRLGRFVGLRMVRASGTDPTKILVERSYLKPEFAAAYAKQLSR